MQLFDTMDSTSVPPAMATSSNASNQAQADQSCPSKTRSEYMNKVVNDVNKILEDHEDTEGMDQDILKDAADEIEYNAWKKHFMPTKNMARYYVAIENERAQLQSFGRMFHRAVDNSGTTGRDRLYQYIATAVQSFFDRNNDILELRDEKTEQLEQQIMQWINDFPVSDVIANMNIPKLAKEWEEEIWIIECLNVDRDEYIEAMASVDGLFKTWRESRDTSLSHQEQVPCSLEGYLRMWHPEVLEQDDSEEESSEDNDNDHDYATADARGNGADTNAQETSTKSHDDARHKSHSTQGSSTSMQGIDTDLRDSPVKNATTLGSSDPSPVFQHDNSVPDDGDIEMTEEMVREDTEMTEYVAPPADPGAPLSQTPQGNGSDSNSSLQPQWTRATGSDPDSQSSLAAGDIEPMEIEEDKEDWVSRAPKLDVPDNTLPNMDNSKQEDTTCAHLAKEALAPEIEMTGIVEENGGQQHKGATLDISSDSHGNQVSHEAADQSSNDESPRASESQTSPTGQWQNASTTANDHSHLANHGSHDRTQNSASNWESNWASSWTLNKSAGQMFGQSVGSSATPQLSSSPTTAGASSSPWTPNTSVASPAYTSPCPIVPSVQEAPMTAPHGKSTSPNTSVVDDCTKFLSSDLRKYDEDDLDEMLNDPSDPSEGRVPVEHDGRSTLAEHDQASIDQKPEAASNPVKLKDGGFLEENTTLVEESPYSHKTIAQDSALHCGTQASSYTTEDHDASLSPTSRAQCMQRLPGKEKKKIINTVLPPPLPTRSELNAMSLDDWLAACKAMFDRKWAINECEERAIRLHHENPTKSRTRLYKIATLAFKAYTFANEWRVKAKIHLPKSLRQHVEQLVDLFRDMDRTDSKQSLQDIRALTDRWISIRRLITAYERLATDFGPDALESMDEDYKEYLKLALRNLKREQLYKKFKEMLAIMGKTWRKFLKAYREACHYELGFEQTPMGQMMYAYVEEGESALYNAHKTLKAPIPGRQNEWDNDEEEL